MIWLLAIIGVVAIAVEFAVFDTAQRLSMMIGLLIAIPVAIAFAYWEWSDPKAVAERRENKEFRREMRRRGHKGW